jgi:hypothetical protein
MPTGYTEGVASGEIKTLQEYAMTCARAMGALVSMRDSSFNAAIPEKLEPSTYHRDQLEKSQEELAILRRMSEAVWEEKAKAAFDEKQAWEKEYARKQEQQRARYERMRTLVLAWQNSPEGLKSFMISQLDDSIKFDCPEGSYFGHVEQPRPDTGREWFLKQERTLLRNIARYSTEYEKELERVEERNKWLEQLRDSLKDA